MTITTLDVKITAEKNYSLNVKITADENNHVLNFYITADENTTCPISEKFLIKITTF